MELIIKPTGKCDFSCSFCSAESCRNISTLDYVNDQLKQILQKMQPSRLIITGGDPLCVSPKFYYDLLELGDWHISLTTNLKEYCLNPAKWLELLKNSRIGICTSFQYGDGRRWDKDTIYTEEKFIEVFDKFKQDTGKTLMFISVISTENEKYALKHLELAKRLKTRCKLNGMMPFGKSIEFYPQYKLIDIWLQAHEKGLSDYLDQNTALYLGGCGLNIDGLCMSTIRALMFDKDNQPRIVSCEDDLMNDSVSNLLETQWKCQPSVEQICKDDMINDECIFCELCRICNGCHQYRKLNKTDNNHCQEMKKLLPRIQKTNWRIY